MTTLERHFGFNSTQTGLIMAANDVGFLVVVLFISYIAAKVSQCRNLFETERGLELLLRTKKQRTGPRSVVVSASDCGSEGLGFESRQSHVGFFNPGRLLPRAGSAVGPVGRLEPSSRASSTSRMRL